MQPGSRAGGPDDSEELQLVSNRKYQINKQQYFDVVARQEAAGGDLRHEPESPSVFTVSGRCLYWYLPENKEPEVQCLPTGRLLICWFLGHDVTQPLKLQVDVYGHLWFPWPPA